MQIAFTAPARPSTNRAKARRKHACPLKAARRACTNSRDGSDPVVACRLHVPEASRRRQHLRVRGNGVSEVPVGERADQGPLLQGAADHYSRQQRQVERIICHVMWTDNIRCTSRDIAYCRGGSLRCGIVLLRSTATSTLTLVRYGNAEHLRGCKPSACVSR